MTYFHRPLGQRNPPQDWLDALAIGDPVIVTNYNARIPELRTVVGKVERIAKGGGVHVAYDVPTEFKLPTNLFVNGRCEPTNSYIYPGTPEDIAAVRGEQECAKLRRKLRNRVNDDAAMGKVDAFNLRAALTCLGITDG